MSGKSGLPYKFSCLKCDSTGFEEKEDLVRMKIKDKFIEVLATAFVCSVCGFQLMNDDQMAELMRKSMNEYNYKMFGIAPIEKEEIHTIPKDQ